MKNYNKKLVHATSYNIKLGVNIFMILEGVAAIYELLEGDPHSLAYKEFFNACEWVLMTLN